MKRQNGLYSVTGEFEDPEWNIAQGSDEKPRYYKVHMLNGGIAYKYYKPSVAKLLEKRNGTKMEEV